MMSPAARGMSILGVALLVSCQGGADEDAASITVFAAASTTDVMQEAARLFEAETGVRVSLSTAGSSNLARQIEAGAPADVFMSADQAWMDAVAATGAILPDTRRDVFANELVVVAATDSTLGIRLHDPTSFEAVERVAIGDPSHVPAGRYARQALTSLGLWSTLEARTLPAQDVRAALRLVEIGEADIGIVYATDAIASSRVTVVARLGPDLHDPIVYPIARCTDSTAAASFIDFLFDDAMRDVFEQAGFVVAAEVAP